MSTWRDRIEVHPAADIFPMMSESEISELASDIRENGQRVGVILWTPERPEDVGPRKRLEKLFLLDGRNRLDAIERAYDDAEGRESAIHSALSYDWRDGGSAKLIYGDEDPYEVAVSANIRRRHLTGEQKREIVAELLKAHPERSDRATAKIANVDHKTVAAVRYEAEGRGEIPHVETRTDTAGRQQPSTKPLTVEITRREIPLNVVSYKPEEVEPSPAAVTAMSLVARHHAQAARVAAPDTMQQLLHLFRLDTAKTLDGVIRTLGTAKVDITTVPKEKRIAAARGCLRALGLSDADLRPIA